MKTKIAFFDAKPYDIRIFDSVNKDFNYDIVYFSEKLNKDTVPLAKGFEVVCPFVNDNISAEIADELYKNGTKLIVLRSAGYNNVDLKSVYKKIHVLRVPAYSPYAVAEHAMALIMALNRKTHKAYFRTRDNNFNINGLLGFDLHGKTMGIIGTGRIGKVFANICTGFGMNILLFDLYPDNAFAASIKASYLSLDEIYAKSDIISLNCPLTKDTFHLINDEAIAAMKKGVMIINTGRGKLINTQSLISGLKSGKIGSAGLDVYEEEGDYFFEDFSESIVTDDQLARLLSFNNVLITSHQAFFTEEALNNIADTTLNNVKTFYNKEPLVNEICYRCGESNCIKEKKGQCF